MARVVEHVYHKAKIIRDTHTQLSMYITTNFLMRDIHGILKIIIRTIEKFS